MHTVSQLENKFRNVIPPPPFFPLILTFGCILFFTSLVWQKCCSASLLFHPSVFPQLLETYRKSACLSQTATPKTHSPYVLGCAYLPCFNFRMERPGSNIYSCYGFSQRKVHFRNDRFHVQISHLSPLLFHWQQSIVHQR